jgi:hypothetical protein
VTRMRRPVRSFSLNMSGFHPNGLSVNWLID